MTRPKFNFEKLVNLLGRSINDPELRNFFGGEIANIKRDEYYGSLEFKPDGVGVVFQEAPWVVPSEAILDPQELYLAAFHLHGEGHEGFQKYSGQMPNAIALGSSEAEVLQKMGEPIKIGGGGVSRVSGGMVPRWFWYRLGQGPRAPILHIQFDANGRVQMVTPRVPNVK